MNKDIHFPQFLHPTLGYKNWLSTDMREVHREEKDHKKSKKKEEDQVTTLIRSKFYFSTLYDFMYFHLS